MADIFEDELDREAGEQGSDGGDPGIRTRATDFMRKALVAGAGALFLTEEGIRSLVGELKLPKELIGTLLAQADRTKQDVVRVLGEEVRRFLESAALHEELGKLLSDMTIEVKAEVRLKPGQPPELADRPQVQIKRGPGRKRTHE
jgi:hypothetical protein